MDRNGKKPKASRGDDASNAERSDTKAKAREASGEAARDALAAHPKPNERVQDLAARPRAG